MTAPSGAVTAPAASLVRRHLGGVAELLSGLDDTAIGRAVDALALAARDGRSVFVFGNGGSAATADHLAADLAEVGGCRTMCLASGLSRLTATANDHGYDEVFTRPLQTWMAPGDIVIAISVSGRSPNCTRAVEYARRHGAVTIGLVGSPDGDLARLAAITIAAHTADHRRAESVHLAVAHALTEAVGVARGG